MTRGRRVVARTWLTGALVTVMLVLTGCDQRAPEAKFQTTDITGVNWGRDFNLHDPAGAPRTLANYRGKVVMLFFGYAHCPDVCPTTLSAMAQVIDRLGGDGARVQGLFVTVDPARDTPQVLAQYVPAFHPSFVGLSADEPTTAATAKNFKVFYAAQKPDDHGFYTVDHSSYIFVFDAEGRLRLLMRADEAVDTIVHDLKVLLRQAPNTGRS